MGKAAFIAAAVAIGLASGAASAGERTGYASIAAGDLANAERTLAAERRIFPDRPELMLNLAAIYGRTGRETAAASLYRDVLAQPAVAMDMPSGATRSSHAIADAALRRLPATVVAAR